MLPQLPVRFRLSSRLRRLRLSRRLALSSTLLPLMVLAALGLAKGGPAEGQRAPMTVTTTPTPWLPRELQGVSQERKEAYWRAYASARQRGALLTPEPPEWRFGRPLPPSTPEPQRESEVAAGDGYITIYQTRAGQKGSFRPYNDKIDFETVWHDRKRITDVYTGAIRETPNVGIVLIFRTGELVATVAPPTETGWLKITGAVDRRLTLVSSTGGTYYLDVDAAKFVQP